MFLDKFDGLGDSVVDRSAKLFDTCANVSSKDLLCLFLVKCILSVGSLLASSMGLWISYDFNNRSALSIIVGIV